MENNLLIIGAGQYGQVTKEIAISTGKFDKIDFLDDNSALAIGKINEYDKFKNDYMYAIVAIGNPTIREKLTEKLLKIYQIPCIISPYAYVSPTSIIDKGCIIEPFSVISTNSKIGISSIICAGAIINHNVIVNDYCHINCGAVISSNSIVPNGTKVDYGKFF